MARGPQPATVLDDDLLKDARAKLKECKAQINSAIQLNQINPSEDVHDPAYEESERVRRRLENALSRYERLANPNVNASPGSIPQNPRGSQDSDKPEPQPSASQKKPRLSDKWMSKLLNLVNKDSKSTKQTVNMSDLATQELKNALDTVNIGLKALGETTSQRSCANDMGGYYILVHCHRLCSMSNQTGAVITGRYEETGSDMLQFVTQLIKIEEELDVTDHNKRDDSAAVAMKQLYTKLGVACDSTIAFLLSVPFDLCGFKAALEKLKSNGELLQDFAEKKVARKGLFDGKSIPKIASSANRTYKYEKMIDEVDAIIQYLENRTSDYELEKAKFDMESFANTPQFQAIQNLGLKEVDLFNTAKVVQTMKKARSEGGLGLPVICAGNSIVPSLQRNGGYGIVSRMMYPVDASGADDAKAAGRLVAVKIITESNLSRSLANLRTLREAFVWSAVSSDPRKLEDGGQHLAQVLGIWDDFHDGRPGFVSLWGECDLKTHIKTQTLDLPQKLELLLKVARGVQYLHTCSPTIVHGDLKAANVIMVDGEPLLTDFGVGKCLDGVRGFTTGNQSYTDDYRAPEIQYREISLVKYPTKESDIYAFGCIVFEVLSGKAPFDGFSDSTRRKWIDSNLDRTPLDAESSKKEPYPFKPEHMGLMKSCFKFHASSRPTMEEVVDGLEDLRKPTGP